MLVIKLHTSLLRLTKLFSGTPKSVVIHSPVNRGDCMSTKSTVCPMCFNHMGYWCRAMHAYHSQPPGPSLSLEEQIFQGLLYYSELFEIFFDVSYYFVGYMVSHSDRLYSLYIQYTHTCSKNKNGAYWCRTMAPMRMIITAITNRPASTLSTAAPATVMPWPLELPPWLSLLELVWLELVWLELSWLELSWLKLLLSVVDIEVSICEWLKLNRNLMWVHLRVWFL